ncbi:MAG: MaoC family dehydratase [Actinobacteria bacterium]|nr:MAG: MaoC family dehydratase [Actinomycetota bacterium]
MPVIPAAELPEHIGEETGRSDWFTIDQDRIDTFAEATMDHQWIHVDPDAAAQGPFGRTIAHGFLTQSLVGYLNLGSMLLPDGAVMFINYGSDKVRFLNPVKVDSRVRTVSVLKDVKEKSPGQILITNSITVEIEGEDKPALVADLLTLAIMGQPS